MVPAVDPSRDAPGSFEERFEWLHERARAETGLRDFGDDTYRTNLRFLLRCYDHEARFGAEGRDRTERMLIDALRGRLRSTERLAAHPEVLELPLEAPLVIAGLPRTGSTALHKLLAADPQMQALEYWLGCEPDRRPPRDEWDQHPSYRAVREALERTYQRSPELRSAHSMVSDEADECRLLFMQDFLGLTFAFNANVPSYEAWLLEQDMRPSYERYRDNLKLIGANEPDRRWVLKNASHLWALSTLDSTLPGACIVVTHRSPFAFLVSVSSLVHKSRTIYEPDVSKRRVGEQQLRQWSRIVRLAAKTRRRDAGLDARILDVHYDRFVADPLATLREIYERFDLPWSADGERRIRDWAAKNPPDRHGTHHYTADEYGLSEAAMREAFGEYLEFERALAERST